MEEIVGILFWKIKDMILKKNFSKFKETEFKNFAARLSYLLPEARKRRFLTRGRLRTVFIGNPLTFSGNRIKFSDKAFSELIKCKNCKRSSQFFGIKIIC